MLILMECILVLAVLDLSVVVGGLLQAYQLFLIVYPQVSGHSFNSKVFFSVPFSDG